jgi:hypothetical protein
MSQKDSNGRRLRAGFSLATAVGGAVAAAALSMGMAHADVVDADGYSDLFGATGTVGYPTAAGLDNASLWRSINMSARSNPTTTTPSLT